MPRSWVFGLLLVGGCGVSGCSTHPISDTMDFFRPGKIGPDKVVPYGGVCIPQGPVTSPAPVVPVVPTAPAVPPIAVPVVPPPAPLPPPTGTLPPPSTPTPSIFPVPPR
jgi:hypothetical protein